MIGRYIMYGKMGEEQKFFADTLGNQRFEIGQMLMLPDGRMFRGADVGAVTLVPGNLLAQRVPDANHTGQTVVTATAAAATAVAVTLAATSLDADEYRNGMIVVESGGTGKGFAYPLASHANAAASAAVSFPLQTGSSVTAAINTSDVVTLLHNPWKYNIVCPTAITGAMSGVAVSAPATAGTIHATGGNAARTLLGNLGWVQTHGPAAVLGNGTIVLGSKVVRGATTAGSVDALATAFAIAQQYIVGTVLRVAASTAWSTIFLELE